MTDPFSATDLAHLCLRDVERTEAFRRAIYDVVSSGDLVLEVGAGSGILSMFAAAAGARRVVAIEIDPLLAAALARTADANGFGRVVEVVNQDALSAPLPAPVDVVICELIDTGLIDEQQVPVLQRLQSIGVIGPETRIIPATYTTYVSLVDVDLSYYGFDVLAPGHFWPYYDDDGSRWTTNRCRPISGQVAVTRDDFSSALPSDFSAMVEFACVADARANALMLSGGMRLTVDSCELGCTPSVNGDKIIVLDQPIEVEDGRATLHVEWRRGGGLGTVRVAEP